MTRKGLIVLFLLLPAWMLHAQRPDGSVMVMAGENATQVIPLSQRYLFPEFRSGQLYFPQGERSEVILMNYNMVLDAMQFIDTKGDTMFIAEDSNIFRYIQIEETLFFHKFGEGYFIVLTREDPIKLLAKKKWNVLRRELLVNNGYGTSASMNSSSAYTARRSDDNTFVQHENTLFGKGESFFLLGPKERLYAANRSGLVKSYPDLRKQVKKYVQKNDIDYRSETDLRQTLTHLNGLVED